MHSNEIKCNISLITGLAKDHLLSHKGSPQVVLYPNSVDNISCPQPGQFSCEISFSQVLKEGERLGSPHTVARGGRCWDHLPH